MKRSFLGQSPAGDTAKRVRGGQLRIGNDWHAISIIAQSQSNPLKAIAEFIKRNWDNHIIVHCEAGVSRSAAVCEVLVRLGWGYKTYTSFGRSQANPLLVRLLVDEFGLHPMRADDDGSLLWGRRP